MVLTLVCRVNRQTFYGLQSNISLQTTSAPNPSTANNTKSTYFTAMIYYRKTLFGSGPKLTAVQKEKVKCLQ